MFLAYYDRHDRNLHKSVVQVWRVTTKLDDNGSASGLVAQLLGSFNEEGVRGAINVSGTTRKGLTLLRNRIESARQAGGGTISTWLNTIADTLHFASVA